MNTKNNRRAQNTDEAIVRAFYAVLLQRKKTVSKVTVREICEEAGINRSTFYAHYRDVFDVLEKVEAQMAKSLTEAFLKKMEAGGHIGECFESLFAFIKEYREFYAIYLNETHTSGIIGLAREAYMDRLKSLSWKGLGFASPGELGYHEDFFIAGMSAMIRRWVNTGCKESPREMCEILGRQYSPNRALFQW